MTELLYGAALGIAAGLAFNRISVFQVKKRVLAKLKKDTAGGKCTDAQLSQAREEADRKLEHIRSPILAVVWAILSGLIFTDIWMVTVKRLEYMAYISIAGSIAAVDLDIRKIPNMSVLSLLAVRTAAIVWELIKGVPAKETLIPSLAGLAIAFVLFQLPSAWAT